MTNFTKLLVLASNDIRWLQIKEMKGENIMVSVTTFTVSQEQLVSFLYFSVEVFHVSEKRKWNSSKNKKIWW